jgi:hypothetical protein
LSLNRIQFIRITEEALLTKEALTFRAKKNAVYTAQDTSTVLIPLEKADQFSTTAFLLFDNTDLTRVRSEFERGNTLAQLNGRPLWTRKTAQDTTKGGTGCNSKIFYRWLMITDLVTDEEYP